MSVRSAISDVFHDRSDFDFVNRRRVFFVISAVAIVIGLGSLAFRGLNLGIDFEGGTAWQGTVAEGRASAGTLRDVMSAEGQGGAKVSILGADRDTFRVQAKIEGDPAAAEAEKDAITAALEEYAGQPLESVSDVGPTFGDEITRKALRALVVFLIVVVLYLAFRFEMKMAGAALTALGHDVGITVGVYSLTGFEVTPATVIAILTILGYSLYDTVVVFDKVKENQRLLGTSAVRTYGGMVNRSLNEVLMRSLNTSITTLIPVASLLVIGSYVLGALTIRDFALALFVGLLAGTYSSIFVASMVLAAWKEREPRYRDMRHRAEQRGLVGAGTGAGAGSPSESGENVSPAEAGEPESVKTGEPPPRRAPTPHPEDAAVLQPKARQPRRRKRRR